MRAGTTGWQRASPLDNGFSVTQLLPIHQVPKWMLAPFEGVLSARRWRRWSRLDCLVVDWRPPKDAAAMGDQKLKDHRESCWESRQRLPPRFIYSSKFLLIIYALLSSFQATWRGAPHCRGQINNLSDIRSDGVESETNDLQAGWVASLCLGIIPRWWKGRIAADVFKRHAFELNSRGSFCTSNKN